MLRYDYEIIYKKDTGNVVADALSRKNGEKNSAQTMALTRVIPS